MEDDLVDVEGEETAVTGDDATEEEEAPADSGQTGSPDAQTTMLFTKPIVTPGTPLGIIAILEIVVNGSILEQVLVASRKNGVLHRRKNGGFQCWKNGDTHCWMNGAFHCLNKEVLHG